MLIKVATLQKIKTGEVTLAFRCWKRPTVKAGGTLKTAIGVVAINSVTEITAGKITKFDAKAAGFEDKADLIANLESRTGQYYRIEVAYAGEDPRISLRADDQLTEDQLAEIVTKLNRYDDASPGGPWTQTILTLIDNNPEVSASILADEIETDKPSFKKNVRKLKSLGLTISQRRGYTLSPRGRVVFDHLRQNDHKEESSTR